MFVVRFGCCLLSLFMGGGRLVDSVFCFAGCGLVWFDYLWFEFDVCGCYGLGLVVVAVAVWFTFRLWVGLLAVDLL